MLKWIIGSSAKFRLLVIAFAATLLAVGIARLPGTAVEALPDFGPVRVEIQTEALGLSPEEAENLITNPMEQEFFTGIPWLHKIRSHSAPGLSAVEMIFEPGTNDIRARQVVQERLTMVPALPAVSKPPYVIQPSATASRLLMIGMSSKELSLVDMSTLARWKVRQRLLSVPGVSSVSIWGLRDRQLQVLIDPHRLRLSGVNVDDVIKTAANSMWSSPLTYVEASTPGTGGFIDTAHQRISINHTQPIKTATELARVTIEGDQLQPLVLGAVADVVEGHQLLIGDAIVKGGAGLMMVVERAPGTSITQVTRDVEHALDAMRPGLKGIEFDTSVFRPVSYVEAARNNLVGSLGLGLVLMAILIGAFMYSWRAALVSVVAIVISFSTALLVLSAYGVMLNLMIVAGLVLALAVVVDDAVVCVDNIRRRIAQDHATGTRQSVFDTVVAASSEVGGPLATALVIVVASVAPLLVLGVGNGDFLKPLALTYALVVSISLFVALTVTPALALALLSGSAPPRESRFARWLASGYQRSVSGVLGAPTVALVVTALIVAGGVATLPWLDQAPVIPALKDRDIVVRLQAAPGTSLPAMMRIATAASAELRATPGVRSVGAHVGRASNSDLVTSVDHAELWVNIAPAADYEATVAAIEKSVRAHPSVTTQVSAYPNLRVREVTAASLADDLVVRVYGRDYKVLQTKAELVAKTLADVPGVSRPQVILPIVEPTIEIEVDVDKASAKGVKPGDVRRAAATLVSSITAGNLFQEQKIFDVVVWGQPAKRSSLTDVQNLLVDAPHNAQVRVGDVADVRIRPNPSVIKHDAVSRYIDVTAEVEGSLGSVTRNVEQRMKQIAFPSEHHVEVMGEATERQRVLRELTLYGLAALVALYFLLQARFDSWRLAGLLFVLLPLPLAGAALGAATQGLNTTLLSLMGALAVLAVAVRGAMLLIERCQRLEREEGQTLGLDLVVRAAQDRFNAVVLSCAASAVALAPLLVYGTVAGLEIVKPLAAMVIGGLAGAALLNLYVLPALYLRFARPLQAGMNGPNGRDSAHQPHAVQPASV